MEIKIPICFYYGDYIEGDIPNVPASGMWNMMRGSAETFEQNFID